MQIIELLIKLNSYIPSLRCMILNVFYSLATFGNTSKVDTKATMNEEKIKNQFWSWCTLPLLSKEKENDIKLKGSQVVLYVNQRGHVKQKSDDLSLNWLNVFVRL